MRILGIGEFVDLGDVYLRLAEEGHAVKVFSAISGCSDILEGMIERVPRWTTELDWIRNAGPEGLIVFETANQGITQNKLRRAGFNVIGGSAFGDRLENDRAFGQTILAELGLRTAAVHDFTSFQDGIGFLREQPGRYVFKANGSAMNLPTYIGQLDNARDMIAQLLRHQRDWKKRTRPRFVLMEHVTGVEVGVGAYFNGEDFLDPPCIDWEHKRFFPGDLGEMTGEMGTVVSYRGAQKLMSETLAKLAPRLREDGYCGYVNLNTIVNDNGIWPLEFTARFGYPGTAILGTLHEESWGTLFRRLIDRSSTRFATRSGFAVGIVLSVPPFPYRTNYQGLSKGMPVIFDGPLSTDERDNIHFWEVARLEDEIVTAGILGQVMVVTGHDTDIQTARDKAYSLAKRVVVPNLRYRDDIGAKLQSEELAYLAKLGLFDADDFVRDAMVNVRAASAVRPADRRNRR